MGEENTALEFTKGLHVPDTNRISSLCSQLGSRCTHSTEGNPRLAGDAPAPREKAETSGPLPSSCSAVCAVRWAPVETASGATLVWPRACHPSGVRTSGGSSAHPFSAPVGGGHELPLSPVCCLSLMPQAERVLKKTTGFGGLPHPLSSGVCIFLSDLPALPAWPSSQWL